MKKTLLMALTVFSVCFPLLSFGQEIEIKGISLGMSKERFDKEIGSKAMKNFTIAGVKSKSSTTRIAFLDNKVADLSFVFDSSGFDDVLSAVNEKYPGIKCEESDAANQMGVKFKQVTCHLEGESGDLLLVKFLSLSNIDTSLLSLMSHRFQEELINKKQEAKKYKNKDI
jgi:hypothetical protein